MGLDKIIQEFIKDNYTLIHHIIGIGSLIFAWVIFSGCIRFGIGAWRRKRGLDSHSSH